MKKLGLIQLIHSIRYFSLLLPFILCPGCASSPKSQPPAAAETQPNSADTSHAEIRACLDSALEALKALDLNTFDTYTNNRQERQSPFGTALEYTMFGELSDEKGGLETSDPAYILDQEMISHLSWNIIDLSKTDTRAAVTVEITNLNMEGIFERSMYVNYGFSDSYMIDEIRNLPPDSTRTVTLTLPAVRKNNIWVFQIDMDFVNAVTGNIWYISPDFEKRFEMDYQNGSAAESMLGD